MDTLILNLDELEFDPGRENYGYTVGGILYLSVGESFFPDRNWYDMIYTDLKEWLPPLISFAQNHSDFCLLRFMDGPYKIHLLRNENGNISASFFDENAVKISLSNVDLAGFMKSVLRAVRKFDRILYENGKPNQFTDEIRKLKSIFKKT